MNTAEHLIMVWIISIVVVILALFTISTLVNYFRQKNRAALYLALNYISFVIAMIFHLVGHFDSFVNDITTNFYEDASMYGKVFIILGILFILLFHAEFTEVNKIWKYIRIFLGITLMIWILFPSNYTFGGRTTVIITYMFMALYGLAINLFLSISFFKMGKKSTVRRKELYSLGLGALSFLIYYILMTIYGMLQSFPIMIITQVDLFIALLFYFIGIYLPKFRSE
ncbi:MAG: hypothetical protein ACFE8E_10210 [Candidatus Hodarchaeota archaeon]